MAPVTKQPPPVQIERRGQQPLTKQAVNALARLLLSLPDDQPASEPVRKAG